MPDQEFESIVRDFQENPGFMPTPEKIDQNALEKINKNALDLLKDIDSLLLRLEKLVDSDFEQCKLEYFNLDYLFLQLPKELKTKKLTKRIEDLRQRMDEKDKEHYAKKIDQSQKDHSDNLKKSKRLDGYDKIMKQVLGLEKEMILDLDKEAKTDEERLFEDIRQDEQQQKKERIVIENKANNEKNIGNSNNAHYGRNEQNRGNGEKGSFEEMPKKEDEEDLRTLQILEKQEHEETKKNLSLDSIKKVEASLSEAAKSTPLPPVNLLKNNPELDNERKTKNEIIPKKSALQQAPKIRKMLSPDFTNRLSSSELYEKGLNYFNNKEYKYALMCFKKVLEIAPNNFAARIRIQQSIDELKKGG